MLDWSREPERNRGGKSLRSHYVIKCSLWQFSQWCKTKDCAQSRNCNLRRRLCVTEQKKSVTNNRRKLSPGTGLLTLGTRENARLSRAVVWMTVSGVMARAPMTGGHLGRDYKGKRTRGCGWWVVSVILSRVFWSLKERDLTAWHTN